MKTNYWITTRFGGKFELYEDEADARDTAHGWVNDGYARVECYEIAETDLNDAERAWIGI